MSDPKIKLHSWTGGDFRYTRGDTGEVVKIDNPTDEQLSYLRQMMEPGLRLDPDDDHNIHRVWHDFCQKFVGPDDKFVARGWELMSQVKEWAEQYSDDVVICRCDDNDHCGSDLVCIFHKAKYQFMGMTIVFIPQCTGEAPSRIFLYPDHNKELRRVLRRFAKEEGLDRSGSPLDAAARVAEEALISTVTPEDIQ